MGNSVVRHFHDYQTGFAPDLTSTGQKDWITLHAELSGLSIVEVERLWIRFQQLGCNDSGVITEDYIREASTFKDDIFMRNILIHMAIDQKVYFHTFLNTMRWANDSSDDEKLEAIYSYFNSGNALGRELFGKILKRVYPDKDEATISQYTDVVFRKLNPSARGEMGYEDFKHLCGGLQVNIASLLDFTVIPREILEDAQQKFSSKWVTEGGEKDKDRSGKALVSSESFDELASLLDGTDWLKVGRALGYSDAQIATLTANQTSDKLKILKLFQKWKESMGSEANCDNLRFALNNSARSDLVTSVYGSAAPTVQ